MSAEDGLSPGTLVRYDETTTRWYIAKVRSVTDRVVTLEYLGGYREDVARAKVCSFDVFLRGRERVLSRTREDLCRVLYGREFERLPQSRLDEMQGFLWAYGLRFTPEVWPPGTRIRISLDGSFVAAGKTKIDPALEALLPRWLEPNRLPPGSRDPLGFQSHAERLANEVLPGLTVFTSRIGYYGFIAWVANRLNQEKLPGGASRRELFHRLERTLALCEFVHHGHEDRSCAIIGQRSKTQILQSAIQDRFRVPTRILKNQESAGAFRLYSTSLESCGFAVQVPEMAAEGLLPIQLTEAGKELAAELAKRVPDGFWDFALSSDKVKTRDTLREWGKTLCFSSLRNTRYRNTFLKSFLLGGTKDAEARHHTVRLLFQRGLLGDRYEITDRRASRRDSIGEDDVGALEEEPEQLGLANRDVLLRFYGEKPRPANVLLQKAAVFEILGVAQTAIFAHAIDAIESSGRASIRGLAEAIVAADDYGALWKVPVGRLAKRLASVQELEQALFETDDPAIAAAIGGALMVRVQSDGAFSERAPDLADTPVMALLAAVDPQKSLAAGYADLMDAMTARHELVSTNKNRRRWCYLEAGDVVKDDPRRLGYGWHALRFPQLWSLCRDLDLTREDVFGGR